MESPISYYCQSANLLNISFSFHVKITSGYIDKSSIYVRGSMFRGGTCYCIAIFDRIMQILVDHATVAGLLEEVADFPLLALTLGEVLQRTQWLPLAWQPIRFRPASIIFVQPADCHISTSVTRLCHIVIDSCPIADQFCCLHLC